MTTTPDIHDMVRALTEDTSHREPYTKTDGETKMVLGHVTRVPALIRQLDGARPAGSREESGGGGGRSRPAARIECIDTLMLIDDEAARWVRRLGDDDPGDTVRCVRLVHALHRGADGCERLRGRRDDMGAWCCTQHHVEHDVRRWWHQARIMSGWDTLPWRPDNTCPVCDQRRTLRINFATESAVCVDCRSIWDATEIGLLAEHIREENREDTAAS